MDVKGRVNFPPSCNDCVRAFNHINVLMSQKHNDTLILTVMRKSHPKTWRHKGCSSVERAARWETCQDVDIAYRLQIRLSPDEALISIAHSRGNICFYRYFCFLFWIFNYFQVTLSWLEHSKSIRLWPFLRAKNKGFSKEIIHFPNSSHVLMSTLVILLKYDYKVFQD